jgi:anti-sigma B factor antagonist
MPFEIAEQERLDVVVLALHGRFTAGPPVEAFRETLSRLAAQGKTRIVLDLRACGYIDSSGLGCLVFAHTRIARAGGHMTLFGLGRRGLELMVVTKLATVFRIFGSESAAIDACFPERYTPAFDVLEFVRSQRGKGA